MFLQENCTNFNDYFVVGDWKETLGRLSKDKLRIKGQTKLPRYSMVYLGCVYHGIALERENGKWFWLHVGDYLLKWVDSQLAKEEVAEN